jgi:hypothetical protein
MMFAFVSSTSMFTRSKRLNSKIAVNLQLKASKKRKRDIMREMQIGD